MAGLKHGQEAADRVGPSGGPVSELLWQKGRLRFGRRHNCCFLKAGCESTCTS